MILHITESTQWEAAVSAGIYRHPTLESEGFIHCSTLDQVVGTANGYYRSRSGLVLLCITVEDLASPLVFEDSYGKGQNFPHIYGVLNLDAVKQVLTFEPQADGLFRLPDGLFHLN